MTAMRSCWECNPAHEHLKRAVGKFWCFVCGRRYEGGQFDTCAICVRCGGFKREDELNDGLCPKCTQEVTP
jgi:hypothetical protein